MTTTIYDSDADGIVDQSTSVVVYVRNSSGTAMTKGQAVYISGATGQIASVSLAKADTELTSSKTIGVLKTDLANNANGYAIRTGKLSGFNTSAFADGDALWLSATTAGQLTTVKPVAPMHMVFMGIVTYAHASNGSLAIAVQNGFELQELHNVLITAIADKDTLEYEAATGLWKNVPKKVLGGYAVSALPAGTVGMRAHVTDALTPTFLAVAIGGGAVIAPVFHNGTAWVIG
jgi:hypothetical protein